MTHWAGLTGWGTNSGEAIDNPTMLGEGSRGGTAGEKGGDKQKGLKLMLRSTISLWSTPPGGDIEGEECGDPLISRGLFLSSSLDF